MTTHDTSGARDVGPGASAEAAAHDRAHLPLQPPPAAKDGRPPRGDATPQASTPTSFYEAVGGQRTFEELGRRFYALVADDPVLRPLYPDDNLEAAERRLVLFLSQYWGGPSTYAAERGHPRLRLRHRPFTIDAAARDAWLANMRQALDDLDLDDTHDEVLWEYLVRAAFSLQNSH